MKRQKYSFDRSFLHSGDLRMFMAINQQKAYDLEEYTRFDNLIEKVGSKKEAALVYSSEAIRSRKEFCLDLVTAPPILVNGENKEVYFNNIHNNGTCLLLGSGNIDKEFVYELHEKGVPVITAGDASLSYPIADYWVTADPLEKSHQHAMYCPRTVCVLRPENKENKVWDVSKTAETDAVAKDMPGVLFTPQNKEYKTLEAWLQEPFVTDFGTGSSLLMAISFAVCTGFSNIIMLGIEQDSKSTVADFTYVNREFVRRVVRCSVVGQAAYHIPSYEREYMLKAVSNIIRMSLPAKVEDREGTVPLNPRKGNPTMLRHRSARLVIDDLYSVLPELMEKAPNMFRTKKIEGRYKELKARLNRGVGCSSCTKKRYLLPAFGVFVDNAKNEDSFLHEVWAEVLPTKFTILIDGELVYRKDSKHLKEEADQQRI